MPHTDRASLVSLLAGAGFIAADEEADELLARAGGDAVLLDQSVRRRLTGEPLAWIVGSVAFCGIAVSVEQGVYVPRWHSEPLALRAAARLPADGAAVDVCTGSGAMAKVLAAQRPGATIVATDIDPAAVACARSNGIDARLGDLFMPVPAGLRGRVDVVVGVVPYVPAGELRLLQRDTFTFETPLGYDGGPDGLTIVRRVLDEARAVLRPGGALLLELGGDQPAALAGELDRLGYRDVTLLHDEEGDVRGIEVTRAS